MADVGMVAEVTLTIKVNVFGGGTPTQVASFVAESVHHDAIAIGDAEVVVRGEDGKTKTITAAFAKALAKLDNGEGW